MPKAGSLMSSVVGGLLYAIIVFPEIGCTVVTGVRTPTPTPTVAVTGVSVSPTSASVNVGSTTFLTATVSPSNATNKNVTWSSSNSSVAAVNSVGIVSGIAAGNATVTATTVDGGFKASSAITVNNTTASYILTIATSGNGTTNPAAGDHTYAAGTAVGVTATPANGATFTGWSGATTGTANPVSITMDGNKVLTASFSGGGTVGSFCSVGSKSVQITEIDVGGTVVTNEDEAALKPLVISPIPSGGSRLAWMGSDGNVHITQLDANDQVTGTSLSLTAHDFSDLYADNKGGVLLATRNAQGGGELNCGQPANLCGTPPNPAIACYDMYMLRFDGGKETWATELTSSSPSLPPYSTGPNGPEVSMIWWYAHHGRIAWDGENYAGYFGSALSVSESSCINIHQGDRMKVVAPSGALQSGGFDWGCSHSGYERIVWDQADNKFVTVCKTDNHNQIALAPSLTTIYPVDLNYSNMGNIVRAQGGGHWLTTSNIRSGQKASTDGLADVHLLHFSSGAADKDIVLASDPGLNDRAPHLAAYGMSQLLAAWETSTATGDLAVDDPNRKLYVQAVDATTGVAQGSPFHVVGITGNRYEDFRAFPDGSVAYPAPGSSSTKVKILRILPCN